MSAASVYQKVSTAWTERRLENVLQRQKELAALHTNVKTQTSALVTAICQDLTTSQSAATEEIRLVLDAVKVLYDELDFPGSLEQEKSIKKGNSVSKNLFALGPTLIEPAASCPLSSTLIPLCASVAAGGAVIALLDSDAPSTNPILRKVIQDSFDNEAVDVAPDAMQETRQHLISRYFGVGVLQNLDTNAETRKALTKANPSIRVLEPNRGLPAIFVDRSTSDLEAVAAHIRFMVVRSTRRNPSRVPRLCFVDEVLIDKLEDLLGGSQELATQSADTDKVPDPLRSLQRLFQMTFPATFTQKNQRSLPSVISLSNTDPITANSISTIARAVASNGRLTLLIPVRSVDHGIDIFNKANGRDIAQAVYIFAEGRTAFYIGQFTQAQHIFVNDIPLRSSVAITPSTGGNSYDVPYRREDFSINHPVIQSPLRMPDERVISSWSAISHRLELSKVNQPKGGRMSFFEQGLLLGMAVLLTATSAAFYVSYRGVRYYIQHHHYINDR